MEMVVQAFFMLLIAVSVTGDKDIRVELQPTLNDHSSFTDFRVWIKNGAGRVIQFIEVKKNAVRSRDKC